MKFFVQLKEENKVTDIIEYPYSDYVEVNLETPLPDASYSGVYQLVNNKLVYRKDWDIEEKTNEAEQPKTSLLDM